MHSKLVIITLTLLALSAGCVQAKPFALAQAAQQQQRPAQQRQKFIPVDGADLRTKFETAARLARSTQPSTPYWTAYSFDVRPGVAVDPSVQMFSGSMENFSGMTIFMGRSGGVTVETRNLAVFLLRDPAANAITRVEVYNLEREREYGGYPVYFLERGSNEESLNLLRGLAESGRDQRIVEHAIVAIALHDDQRVAALLKNFARASASDDDTRGAAIFWLGQVGGEQNFLADIVRNDQEHTELRRNAAYAIGVGREPNVLQLLQSLYDTVANPEVKRGLIHAVSINDNREAVIAFLLKIARSDPDRESRQQAIHWLGQRGGESVIDDLMKIYETERDRDVKSHVLHALYEIDSPRATARLLSIARGGDDTEIRGQAIHWLGQKGESVLDDLMKIFAAESNREIKGRVLHALYEMNTQRSRAALLTVARNPAEDAEVRTQAIHWLGELGGDAMIDELMNIFNSERNTEVRGGVLHAFSKMDSPRAEAKLFEIARRSDDQQSRGQAIHWLGQRAGERSLRMLASTINSSSEDTEIQAQALHAISQRPRDEAIPLLIRIARTHPNPEVRRQAIHWLGQTGDERALEFFRELLSR
ncbi:MAG TPA: HEAT repeat domain-containing protein [Pyrinomonadaceae bacterium]|nr:HEAT repeat domain-containing protein [Pyrinomonadaceae bacterium]